MKKMKLIHLIAILLLIGLLITVASMFYSADSMNTFFTYLSWVEFLVFSFLITFAFSDKRMIIRILVFLSSFTLLGGGYVMLERLFGLNMLFINCIVLLLFLLFVTLLLTQPSSQLPISNKSTPQNPVKHILSGRITNESQLRLFYEEQELDKCSFETFVRAALAYARETLDNDQWKLVSGLLEPIVLEFQEQQPFNELLKGQEKEMIHQIYRLTNLSEFPNRESVIFHLNILVGTIHEREQVLQEEKKRNSQSLTMSTIGLILTIILSAISICIGLFEWHFN